MNVNRVLPLLNLAGCLLITGVIGAQWLKERGIQEKMDGLEKRLAESNGQYEAEKKRASALESDVVQLKESISDMMESRKEMEKALAAFVAERDAWTANAANAASTADANQQQLKTWETAVAARDEKIRELGESLAATRERLNQAIAKLKDAGAR